MITANNIYSGELLHRDHINQRVEKCSILRKGGKDEN